ASSGGVEAFLDAVANAPVPHSGGRGRLVFALDATMSRQPTWDIAQGVQARMLETASALGGLDVQLVYFRGFMECRASRFIADGAGLAGLMGKIDVRGGQTQIAKVLRHVLGETKKAKVGALVYVGDAMEEDADELCQLAGELGLLGVKAFLFHEGHDADAGSTFREIARLTGGAYAAFDRSAPSRLADLLGAAAAYAAGGRAALEEQARRGGEAARALLTQMK
ncbi:MAG: VWA domain-containing protein, partial [Beijerinckiaceae bacterium]